MTLIPRRMLRIWAVAASLFAVFSVTGVGVATARDASDCPAGLCDGVDDGDAAPLQPDLRRRHSDVV